MIELVPGRNEAARLEQRAKAWQGMVRGQLLRDVARLTTTQAKERVSKLKASPDGEGWAPRKDDLPHPLMVRTGKMLRSIRERRSAVAEYISGVASLTPDYPKFHHTGTRRMPARPFVGVGRKDAEEIGDLIDTFVELRF